MSTALERARKITIKRFGRQPFPSKNSVLNWFWRKSPTNTDKK